MEKQIKPKSYKLTKKNKQNMFSSYQKMLWKIVYSITSPLAVFK